MAKTYRSLRCSLCKKPFHKQSEVAQHAKDYHGKGAREVIAEKIVKKPRNDDDSIADLMIEAHIAKECGEPYEEWLIP